MLHPDYVMDAPNRLGAFNTVTAEGRDWFVATLEFLAERWSRPDQTHGRVVRLYPWKRSELALVVEQHGARHDASSSPRTTAHRPPGSRAPSADNHPRRGSTFRWNTIGTSATLPAIHCSRFLAAQFVEYFAARARQEGDFDWHLAFHPYPENLFEPRFWQDRSATCRRGHASDHIQESRAAGGLHESAPLQYAGQPRRIILSEQGFHTPLGPDGEKHSGGRLLLRVSQGRGVGHDRCLYPASTCRQRSRGRPAAGTATQSSRPRRRSAQEADLRVFSRGRYATMGGCLRVPRCPSLASRTGIPFTSTSEDESPVDYSTPWDCPHLCRIGHLPVARDRFSGQ